MCMGTPLLIDYSLYRTLEIHMAANTTQIRVRAPLVMAGDDLTDDD